MLRGIVVIGILSTNIFQEEELVVLGVIESDDWFVLLWRYFVLLSFIVLTLVHVPTS